ncbi:MAG TPA: O-antigen ligase family protein [Pyrinomonadaceae bacterium]|nr:O-antigen ligase family protein [Pyrinomonadaceae bacterium]
MSFSATHAGAEIESTSTDTQRGALLIWLERALAGCLFLLAFCAPHSIAGTQIAWGVGLLLWALRFAFRPRPRTFRTPVDYALLGFFILTFISALASYDPDVSIGKLRAASLFTIVYLVAENTRTRRMIRLLVFTLIASCMINVVYTFGERAVGRGVKVSGMTADSPLRGAGIKEGDTLLRVDRAPSNSPDALARALVADATGTQTAAYVQVYRREWVFRTPILRGSLLAGATPEAQLGLTAWARGRDERASGFYGHYTTYAEVLQLIGSLAVGLLIALRRKRSWQGALLALAVAGLGVALLLTVTRASWLSLLLSTVVMALVGAGSRRAVAAVALGALLVVPLGLYVLQQKRGVGFFDRKDGSISWRATVYREGFDLFVREPRHIIVGVGMDTIKRHWREWRLFDGGRLPVGHMHSTPLQFALERGLPALLMWLAVVFLYARMLWRLWRSDALHDWRERGLVLGALGGLVGFCASGLVHYNFGDSEVVMIFYLIMGLTLALERFARQEGHVEANSLNAEKN